MSMDDIEDGFEIAESYYDGYISKPEAIHGLGLIIDRSDTKAVLKSMRTGILMGFDRETVMSRYQHERI